MKRLNEHKIKIIVRIISIILVIVLILGLITPFLI